MSVSAVQAAKLWLVEHTGLARDALHIYVALGLLFGAALMFKWPLSSWRPWLVVLAAAVLGEVVDVVDRAIGHGPFDLTSDWHDLWNTMFWPSAILVLARVTQLFGALRPDGLEQPFE